MLSIKVKKIHINYLNYFNKTILTKNIILGGDKSKSFLLKIKRIKTTSKIVTLRAPKHFKVGRHHYSVITKLMQYKFNLNCDQFYLEDHKLYYYLNFFKNCVLSKKIPSAFNNLTSIKITYKVNKNFILY